MRRGVALPRLGLQRSVMELEALTPIPKVPGLGDPVEPIGYKQAE